MIFSNDGGASFKEPVSIDEGKPIGRVDLLMLDEKAAMVSWMEGKDIKAVRVNADGTKGQSILIGTSSEARSSGFPQMTRAGDKLLFAWSDAATKTIKVVSISL